MDLARKKINGSTLIESVTAMTLVLLITGLVFTFFTSIHTGGIQSLKLEAFLSRDRILSDITKDGNFSNDSWTEQRLTINKKVTQLDQSGGIYLVELEFSDQKNHPILSCKTILAHTTKSGGYIK
ncbi:MAG: hypothetical protein Q8O72_01820 [Bacteroidales bacterium]|nr:hypothetical protein [Bacteroidales bacterium]